MAQVNLKDPSKVTLVKGDSGTAEPKVGTNPTPQINYTFSRDDIRKLADERIAQAKEEGEFDDGIEANPTLAGTESALTGLKVNNVKYKVEQPINVAANPTLAGTEAELSGLEVGSTKYKIPEGTPVEANPTLDGTEANLEGLQVGSTKYKVGGGGGSHCYEIIFTVGGYSIEHGFLYYTDADLSNAEDFRLDFIAKHFERGIYAQKIPTYSSTTSTYPQYTDNTINSVYKSGDDHYIRTYSYTLSIVDGVVNRSTVSVTVDGKITNVRKVY